jgi:hypothetical protein
MKWTENSTGKSVAKYCNEECVKVVWRKRGTRRK